LGDWEEVVLTNNNAGTTTLRSITIKIGDARYGGGGLYVQNSNVVLILVAFSLTMLLPAGEGQFLFTVAAAQLFWVARYLGIHACS